MTSDRDFATVLHELADRDAPRREATVQAGVRELLLSAPLDLVEHHVDLESQVGDRCGIDIEVGFTVIEVKMDLRPPGVLADALDQLAGYVRVRSDTLGQRYVGVLTYGTDWQAFDLRGDKLLEVAAATASASRAPLCQHGVGQITVR